MSIFLSACRDGWTGGIQLSIEDENCGYRLAGPKFNGSSETLLRVEIDEHMAKKIRGYLDQEFPVKKKKRKK